MSSEVSSNSIDRSDLEYHAVRSRYELEEVGTGEENNFQSSEDGVSGKNEAVGL